MAFSGAFEIPPGSYSRYVWQYVLVACIGVSLFHNFVMLTLELIDNCSIARYKFIRFVYLREKENLAFKRKNRELMNTVCEPITQIEPDKVAQMQMRKELEANQSISEE
jgi:hypothetical protein